MSHAPTPQSIHNFKTVGQTRNAAQYKLYDTFTDLYLQEHALDVMMAKDAKTKVKPVGLGEAGFAVDQRTSVLLGDIFVRYAPLGAARAEKHVSGKLEPFVNTSLTIMDRTKAVRAPSTRQMVLHGVAYNLGPMPAPAFWATEDMEELVAKGDKEGQDEYRAANFPLVWRHMDTHDVVAVCNDRGDPYKLVYCRQMYAGDIIDRWGESALPTRRGWFGMRTGGYGMSEQIEVLDYVDDEWVMCLVGSSGDNMAYAGEPWEHHMGVTPVTPWIGNEIPKNKSGIQFAGVLMHPREMMQSRDETATDLRTTIRENTQASMVAYLDLEARARNEGWPTKLTSKAGEIINMLKGETLGRATGNEFSEDGYRYLQLTDQYLGNQIYRDALGGTGGGGESAAHLNTANQAVKAELVTYIEGVKRAYVRAGELVLRSVCAINYGLTDFDKVTVRTADPRRKSEAIEASPEDVKAYFDLGSCNLKLALPVNENFAIMNYKSATESGLYDPYLGRQIFGDIADPMEVDERKAEFDLFQAVVGVAIEEATKRARQTAAMQGALPLEQMLANSGDLPEWVPQMLMKLAGQGAIPGLPAPGGGAPGVNGYDPTAMNMAQAGQGQQLSDLASMGVGSGV